MSLKDVPPMPPAREDPPGKRPRAARATVGGGRLTSGTATMLAVACLLIALVGGVGVAGLIEYARFASRVTTTHGVLLFVFPLTFPAGLGAWLLVAAVRRTTRSRVVTTLRVLSGIALVASGIGFAGLLLIVLGLATLAG